MILVGDIGGTNTRLALARLEAGTVHVEQLQRHPTPPELAPLLRDYLRHAGAPTLAAAALCGAGPRRADGSIALTNHPCVLRPAELAAAAGLPRLALVNDFEAVAQALPLLGPADLQRCGGRGDGIVGATRLVLGPGTGLGVAALAGHGDDWQVLAGEGGHVDLAPVDDEEIAVWLALRQTHGALSAETVLSGPGLERLHVALHACALPAPAITAAARAGEAAALRTLRVFTLWLGRVAGNAALTLGARGGVYLTGGIVPAWGALFDQRAFRAGFEDKAGAADWLAAVPSWIITHPEPALIGLTRLAAAA